jgi:hypothetical protein
MKQNVNAQMPPPSDSTSLRIEDISDEERINVLTSIKSNVPMKKPEKKDFLKEVMLLRNEFLNEAMVCDTIHSTNTLHESLKTVIPTSMTGLKTNKSLAEKMVQLHGQFLLLHQYFENRMKSEEALSRTNLRNTPSRLVDQMENKVYKKLVQYFKVMKKVDELVVSEKSVSKFDKLGGRIVSLTQTQRERTWKKDHVPNIPSLQTCIACKHRSTNLPPENDEMVEYNKLVLKNYEKDVKLWREHQKALSEGRSSQAPRGLKQHPSRPKTKEPILQCMCSTSFCIRENSDEGSTCPIKCQKKDSDERYPFSSDGGAMMKQCTCPICTCKCSYTCFVADMDKLLLTNSILPAEIEKMTDQASNECTSTENCSSFIGGIMDHAMSSACSTIKADLLVQPSIAGMTSSTQRLIEQHAKNNFFCDAAEGIAKGAVQNLSHADQNFLRTGLGKPSTIIPLPNGTCMDTRITLQNSDAHSKNNRLGTTEGGAKYHDGMKSKRDIDFSNPCHPFLQAAAKRKMISPSPHAAKRAATAMAVSKHTNYYDLINSDEEVPRLSLFSAAETKQNKQDIINDQLDIKMDEMYSRVICKSQEAITNIVTSITNNDDPDGLAAKKKVMKGLKKTSKQLLQSFNDGTHINDMKQVTKGGTELLESPVPPSSQDIFERLAVFHDDE